MYPACFLIINFMVSKYQRENLQIIEKVIWFCGEKKNKLKYWPQFYWCIWLSFRSSIVLFFFSKTYYWYKITQNHVVYIENNDKYKINFNHIDGVIVSVFVSSAVDCEFETRAGQTKNYKIGICCFSAKHASLRRKSRLVGWESG